MSRKKEATAKQTTRQLIGIDEITDSGLKTSHGRLIFFAIKPTNLSVQPPEAVSNRIYALMTVLKGQAEIEMLAPHSKESFETTRGTIASGLPRRTCRSSAGCWRRTLNHWTVYRSRWRPP